MRNSPHIFPVRTRIRSGFALFALFLVLTGCAATSVKLKCEEIKLRLGHESLSEDERHFAEEELRECQQAIEQANRQDSSSVKSFENRLSPQEDSL